MFLILGCSFFELVRARDGWGPEKSEDLRAIGLIRLGGSACRKNGARPFRRIPSAGSYMAVVEALSLPGEWQVGMVRQVTGPVNIRASLISPKTKACHG